MLSIPGLGISKFNDHSLLGFGLGLGLVKNLLPDCENVEVLVVSQTSEKCLQENKL